MEPLWLDTCWTNFQLTVAPPVDINARQTCASIPTSHSSSLKADVMKADYIADRGVAALPIGAKRRPIVRNVSCACVVSIKTHDLLW